jgi:hypothetical protein
VKEKILADIREALRTPMPEEHPDPGPDGPQVPSEVKDPVSTFRERFEAAGGVWIESEDELPPDAEVTDCDLAIAETGSIGLIAREGRGRRAGLLPDVHAVRLRRDQIVATLEEWFEYLRPRMGSQAVLITGPSRSADIEQILTIGVHGPGKLYAIVRP